MGISLKPEHLKRYRDIARLLMKYGKMDLLQKAGLEEALDAEPVATDGQDLSGELAQDLEKLGPTFIKLGQLLSTRPDILPPAYIKSLARLQDNVEPFSYDRVEAIVAVELGVRISKAFSTFEATPIAAASLGQVHRATLRDGRRVAVKVQRPDIRDTILQDLEAIGEVAEILERQTDYGKRAGFVNMLDEFRRSMIRELDYRLEAQNLATLRTNLAEFELIVVPAPVEDYTTSRVLTMDYVSGAKITKLSPLVRLDLDGAKLAEQLFRAYLQQILIDGFFHADPHPGNVFLTDDGRIALLDLGMVARIGSSMQEKLLQLVLALSEGRSEDVTQAGIKIGHIQPDFDPQAFHRRVSQVVDRTLNATAAEIEVGRLVLEVARVSVECGIRLPSELTMLGKTLLNLDQVGHTLDPTFDPNASIRQNAADMMQKRMRKSLSPANLFSSMIELKDFLERLPRRLNQLLDLVAANELSVRVDAIDEEGLMEAFQKVANRITMGLILASLIVGAAMLMSVPTSFRLFGYPGLAIILFLLAAAGGVALMLAIIFSDVEHRAPRPSRRRMAERRSRA